MNNKDGFPEEYHLGPIIDRVGKAVDFILKRFIRTDNNPPKQFVPFEQPNYWKAAESLHDDGATSPSTFDTFDRPKQ